MNKKHASLSRTIPEQKYSLIDTHTIGDQLYELRLYGEKTRAIYNYSNKFKTWVPYAKRDIDRHWKIIREFTV